MAIELYLRCIQGSCSRFWIHGCKVWQNAKLSFLDLWTVTSGWHEQSVDSLMRLELSYFELGIDVFLGSPGGKSSVLLDVKPWDDETDMKKLEECVRSVSMPGLFWGACEYHTFSVFMGCFKFFILNLILMSIHMCQDILPFSLHVVCICAAKFVQVVAGIKKLQIMMTIVDDEVSVDNLIEDHLTSEPNNEYIQSCDIVAFNKICKFQLLFLHPISYVTTLLLHFDI
jgi:translation elongation factor EF-1beta